jgi:Ran GTPase-activating protein (RanGAP) involved in mRNA processing and transport
MRGNLTLEALDLSSNDDMGDDGAQVISDALVGGRMRLKSLRLSNIRMGPQGADALSAALHTLETLDVSGNIIGDEGASFLARAPSCDPTMHLGFSSSGFAPAGEGVRS